MVGNKTLIMQSNNTETKNKPTKQEDLKHNKSVRKKIESQLAQTPETRLYKSKLERWLLGKYSSLTKTLSTIDKLTSRFVQASIPALLGTCSGFVGEPGDIQICLGVNLDPSTGGKQCKLIYIGEDNETKTKCETKTDQEAENLFYNFVTDFPRAIVTTDQGRPLCLYSGKNENKKFIGYLSLYNFREAKNKKCKDITVGVPNV